MFLERLGFSKENSYNALELSIHLARYSLAQKFCQGLDVLDVACGEGYGSHLMANYWGAKSVKAVDISLEAIEIAQANLKIDNIEYFCHNAEEIDSLFPAKSFDMVISLETIEHVNNPEKFLAAIKQVLKPDGIAIISCPNDHWYYGSGKSGNPYHLHTYYFDEFKELAERLLGTASCYLLGVPLYGFGNFPHSDVAKTENNMMSGLLSLQSVNCNSVNPQESISVDNCAYFVGIWGNISNADNIACSVIYPSLMIDELQASKDWLESQYLSWKQNAEDTHTELERSQLWLKELEQGKDWLESQCLFWKQNAEDTQTELERSQLWLKELEQGKDWLESQYLFWKQNAEDTHTELERSQFQLQQMQRELEQSQFQLQQTQGELEQSQFQLQQTQGELEQSQFQLQQTQGELEQSQFQLQQTQGELEQSQFQLQQTQTEFCELQASKFWKIRTQWFKLKQFLGIYD